MISIVIAMRSLWACKILNEKKKIEVRKGLALYNALKRAEERGEEVEFLMYVTKAKPYLAEVYDYERDSSCSETTFAIAGQGISESEIESEYGELNGKVVARFKAKAEEIEQLEDCVFEPNNYQTETLSMQELLHESRLEYKQLDDYLKGKEGTALHIEDLEIFDKPKELDEFVHPLIGCSLYCDNNLIPSFCRNYCSHNTDDAGSDVWCDRDDKLWKPLDKAPRSWCYAEERKK